MNSRKAMSTSRGNGFKHRKRRFGRKRLAHWNRAAPLLLDFHRQRREWHIQRVGKTSRFVGKLHLTAQLLPKRADHASPKAPPVGHLDGRPASLNPCQMETLLVFDGPSDFNCAPRDRERSKFCGVGTQLIERYRQ